MSFRDQPYAARFAAMGDEAEAVFETVWPTKFVRYGLDRPPIQVKGLPAMIRYTPDYLTAESLVEVQGFGSDNTMKFKTEKLETLEAWDDIMPVKFFLYHRTTDRWAQVGILPLGEAVVNKGTLSNFNDGNEYWALHKRDLEVDWVEVVR